MDGPVPEVSGNSSISSVLVSSDEGNMFPAHWQEVCGCLER